MSDGIGVISKGAILQAVEKVTQDKQMRSDFLDALRGTPKTPGTDWIDFLGEFGDLDPADEDYFRNAWLAQFWSPTYPVDAIVRQGFLEAIELANRDPATNESRCLPIDGYWLWTNDRKFEVLIALSPQQVTCIFLTPPPPTRPIDPARLTVPVPLFVVKAPGYARPEDQEFHKDLQGKWITVQLKIPQ